MFAFGKQGTASNDGQMPFGQAVVVLAEVSTLPMQLCRNPEHGGLQHTRIAVLTYGTFAVKRINYRHEYIFY